MKRGDMGTLNMARDTRDTRWGGYLGVGLLLAGGMLLAVVTAPAGMVSAETVPTVTPFPGPVATATAAAQQMNQAENARAQAARAQQQAQAAAAQAQQAAAAADASFSAAQQAANEARALLASQQVAAASEALGRAESGISAGQERVNDLAGLVDSLNATIGQQAEQITALTIENQQLRIDKQTLLANYTAMKAAADEAQSRFTINPAVAILAGGFLLAIVLVFVMWKWSRAAEPIDQPVITSSYTIADEPIEDGKDVTA